MTRWIGWVVPEVSTQGVITIAALTARPWETGNPLTLLNYYKCSDFPYIAIRGVVGLRQCIAVISEIYLVAITITAPVLMSMLISIITQGTDTDTASTFGLIHIVCLMIRTMILKSRRKGATFDVVQDVLTNHVVGDHGRLDIQIWTALTTGVGKGPEGGQGIECRTDLGVLGMEAIRIENLH